MAFQNLQRFSRCHTGGRPGERNLFRVHRSEARRWSFIATSNYWALRRPVESAQYAAGAYADHLGVIGATPSMSRTGNCYDNAPMESFFHTLKVELVHQCRWATQAQARQALFGYVEGYYNRHRMHSALRYLTPEQAEQRMTG